MADAHCFDLTRLSTRQERQIGFWQNADKYWPRDARGCIFLARAVLALGKETFPEWTELDPVTFPATDFGLKQFDTIEKGRAEAVAKYFGATLSANLRDNVELLNSLLAALKPDHSAAFDRMSAIQEAIIDAAVNERLRTYTRINSTGEYLPLAPNLWNGERLQFRFWCGQMNPLRPFDQNYYWRDGAKWIFVSAEDLAKMINPSEPKADALADKNEVEDDRLILTDDELLRRYSAHCQKVYGEGGYFPARDESRAWARELTDAYVSDKQFGDMYKTHSRQHPRQKSGPRRRG